MSTKNEWIINNSKQLLRHYSGLHLKIEGDMQDPEEIILVNIPENISSLNLATLIREGVELCKGSADQQHSTNEFSTIAEQP